MCRTFREILHDIMKEREKLNFYIKVTRMVFSKNKTLFISLAFYLVLHKTAKLLTTDWLELGCCRFFEDILFSRTNSNVTYRVDL